LPSRVTCSNSKRGEVYGIERRPESSGECAIRILYPFPTLPTRAWAILFVSSTGGLANHLVHSLVEADSIIRKRDTPGNEKTDFQVKGSKWKTLNEHPESGMGWGWGLRTKLSTFFPITEVGARLEKECVRRAHFSFDLVFTCEGVNIYSIVIARIMPAYTYCAGVTGQDTSGNDVHCNQKVEKGAACPACGCVN
jgi:hypothetical protein